MSQFFTLPTKIGQGLISNAIAYKEPLNIANMAIGDGGGSLPSPDASVTRLVNEVRRGPINQITTDPDNPNWIIVEQVLPPDVGGWTIREVGLYDTDGNLVAYGNYPETYKPQLSEGSSRTQTIRFVMETTDTSAVTLKIDPAVVMASRQYVDDSINKHAKSRNHPLATTKLPGFMQLGTAEETREGKRADRVPHLQGVHAAFNQFGMGVTQGINYPLSSLDDDPSDLPSGTYVIGKGAAGNPAVNAAIVEWDRLYTQSGTMTVTDAATNEKYTRAFNLTWRGTWELMVNTTALEARLKTAQFTEFTTSGTFKKDPCARLIIVELIGGGASGPAVLADVAQRPVVVASGSGGGEFVSATLLASDVPDSVSVVIGRGGTGPAFDDSYVADRDGGTGGFSGSSGGESRLGSLISAEGGRSGSARWSTSNDWIIKESGRGGGYEQGAGSIAPELNESGLGDISGVMVKVFSPPAQGGYGSTGGGNVWARNTGSTSSPDIELVFMAAGSCVNGGAGSAACSLDSSGNTQYGDAGTSQYGGNGGKAAPGQYPGGAGSAIVKKRDGSRLQGFDGANGRARIWQI